MFECFSSIYNAFIENPFEVGSTGENRFFSVNTTPLKHVPTNIRWEILKKGNFNELYEAIQILYRYFNELIY